jgi:hypothetical protein
MTALDPASRPKAGDLMSKIQAEYRRSCCFQDLHSDESSWEGSNDGGDVFETAQAVSDVTTLSSGTVATPRPLPLNPTLKQQDHGNGLALPLWSNAPARQDGVIRDEPSLVYRHRSSVSPPNLPSMTEGQISKSLHRHRASDIDMEPSTPGYIPTKDRYIGEGAHITRTMSSKGPIPAPNPIQPFSLKPPTVQDNEASRAHSATAEI